MNYRGFVIERERRKRGFVAHTPEPIHSIEIGTFYNVELPNERNHPTGYYESEADAMLSVDAYLQNEEDKRVREQERKCREEHKVKQMAYAMLVAMLVAVPFVIYFGWSFLRSLSRIEVLLMAILVVLCVGLLSRKQ